jgi:site-specific DNA-methyltransferase (adenine-specific)
MANVKTIETLFHLFDQGAQLLRENKRSYMEALIMMGESVFEGELVVPAANDTRIKMNDILERIKGQTYDREEVRRSFQLAILKGLQGLNLPAGALITPDAVCLLVANLVRRFIGEDGPVSVVDLGCGSGNLLTAVLNHLPARSEAYGIDIDPLFIRLAYVNANLQQHEAQFFRQDALQRIFFPQVNVVLADLPVGEYMDTETAKYFDLYVENEPNYVHHLLMEQALHIAQDGAYLFLLIPNQLFTESGADRLRQLITMESYIQALLELPESLFQTGSIKKSIFILQKKGETVQRPNHTLLARLPSLTDKQRMAKAWRDIEAWLNENGKKGRGV